MKLSPLFNLVLWLLITGSAAATLLGFLGRVSWPFELFSHFRVQYAVVLLVLALAAFLTRNPAGGVISLFFATVNLALIMPFLASGPVAQAAGEGNRPHTLRAMLANVHRDNVNPARAIAYVQQTRPDLVLFLETTTPFVDGVREALPEYELYAWPRDDDPSGLALLSRLPLENVHLDAMGDLGRPAVVAEFTLGEKRVTLIGPHPGIPLGGWLQRRRNAELAYLAEWVASRPGDVLVLGDLNVTPWSPYFQDLLRDGGLRSGREGHGLHPTWPLFAPPFLIPIDHVLVTPGLSVTSFTTGPHVGSDHLPVLVEIGP